MDIFGQINKRSIRAEIMQYRSSLYRVALSWTGDQMLADDITQDTMARALTKYYQLKDHTKLEHWLFRILNNCWREYLRRQRPTIELDDLILISEDVTETGVRKQQVAERVRMAISTLPLGQRQAVTMVDLKGFSYAEVSEILEIPLGTVMSRLSRARNTLKKQLLSLQGELSPQRCHVRRVK